MKSLVAFLWAILPVVSTVSAGPARPFEIAHRGASGFLPEHTLEAVALAHGLGAAYIEQDVVLSSDDVPVVLHDLTLDATTDVATRFPGRARKDGKHYAFDFTLAELKSLEVRERFHPETGKPVHSGRYPGKGPVFHLATLEESLALVSGLNASTGRTVGVYVEIKRPAWHLGQGKDPGKAVVAMLERFGYREKTDACYVQCFEHDEVRRLRDELGWKGRLVQLLGGDKPGEGNSDYARFRTPEGLKELAALVDGIGPAMGDVVTGAQAGERTFTTLVAHAHAAGLEVHPYTARADALPKWASRYEDVVEALREAGVDGYFTDFPGGSQKR
jgi:glycerophosphoryl diester phosphodiesterase